MAIQLPETGYVRLPVVLAHFPVGRTKFLEGVKCGMYPAPIKLGPRINAWRAADIRALLDNPPTVKGAPAPTSKRQQPAPKRLTAPKRTRTNGAKA